MRLGLARTLLLCCLLGSGAPGVARADEYYGQVTFGGVPVPGATVTATLGAKIISVTTDERGLYRFADLAEGDWKIEIKLQFFQPIRTDVKITANVTPGNFELAALPLDNLKALAKTVQPRMLAQPTSQTAAVKNPNAANAPVDIPKPPEDANQLSANGLLVNGSVNNAATSQYSLNQAFGNRRPNARGLYNGGFLVNLDNSALDARQYSLSGFSTPKPAYNRITAGLTVGGPLKIPHILPRGPAFFFTYQGTRDHNALTNSALVPTEAERAGNLANAVWQPSTIVDPAAGKPYPGSVVPVSAQAQALLALYPLPNVSGNPLYNYQAPVLNSRHKDVVQLRLDKTLGRKDQLYGNFDLQSTRADSVSLFRFVDAADTLGLNTNVNWAHRFNQHVFGYLSYRFSRLRTLERPQFEHRENIAGEAGIGGDDQDPAQWGPPALNFSSGITALSDAQSEFNRNRTDGISPSASIYRRRHNITVGGDVRWQQFNENFEQDPRGSFTFTGATTGSDLADFLIGVPDASSIAYGNADKYLRQKVV